MASLICRHDGVENPVEALVCARCGSKLSRIQPGAVFLERYFIEKCLSETQTGFLYLAQIKAARKACLLREIIPATPAKREDILRFDRSARHLIEARPHCLVPVLERFFHRSCYYTVEDLPGVGNLHDAIGRQEAFPEERASELFCRIVSGLKELRSLDPPVYLGNLNSETILLGREPQPVFLESQFVADNAIGKITPAQEALQKDLHACAWVIAAALTREVSPALQRIADAVSNIKDLALACSLGWVLHSNRNQPESFSRLEEFWGLIKSAESEIGTGNIPKAIQLLDHAYHLSGSRRLENALLEAEKRKAGAAEPPPAVQPPITPEKSSTIPIKPASKVPTPPAGIAKPTEVQSSGKVAKPPMAPSTTVNPKMLEGQAPPAVAKPPVIPAPVVAPPKAAPVQEPTAISKPPAVRTAATDAKPTANPTATAKLPVPPTPALIATPPAVQPSRTVAKTPVASPATVTAKTSEGQVPAVVKPPVVPAPAAAPKPPVTSPATVVSKQAVAQPPAIKASAPAVQPPAAVAKPPLASPVVATPNTPAVHAPAIVKPPVVQTTTTAAIPPVNATAKLPVASTPALISASRLITSAAQSTPSVLARSLEPAQQHPRSSRTTPLISQKKLWWLVMATAVVAGIVLGWIWYSGSLLRNFNLAISKGQLFAPPGASAYDFYQKAIQDDGSDSSRVKAMVDKAKPQLQSFSDQQFKRWHETFDLTAAQWDELEKAEEWLVSINPSDTNSQAHKEYAAAQVLYSQQKYSEALEGFQRALQHIPDWDLAALGVGDACLALKRYVCAETYYTRAKRRGSQWDWPDRKLADLHKIIAPPQIDTSAPSAQPVHKPSPRIASSAPGSQSASSDSVGGGSASESGHIADRPKIVELSVTPHSLHPPDKGPCTVWFVSWSVGGSTNLWLESQQDPRKELSGNSTVIYRPGHYQFNASNLSGVVSRSFTIPPQPATKLCD